MDTCHTRNACSSCPGRLVCHCLQVTEEMLLEALDRFELQTIKDIRQHTGAGDGCTACHKRLRGYLESHQLATQSASS
jgi:bacterioferritin-associated ferredoxin